MTSGRLPWLLALLVALLFLRTVVPPSTGQANDIAQAVPRQSRTEPPALTPQRPAEPVVRPRVARLEAQTDRPGNAFAVRTVAPVMAPGPPAANLLVAAMAPQLPPPPVPLTPQPAPVTPALPAPAFQVIGTWDDGGAPGVFLAGPQGTLLARQGSVLMAEYNVVRITAKEVSLLHMASNRELQLPIPQVTPTAARP